jgi:hypothetical protein
MKLRALGVGVIVREIDTRNAQYGMIVLHRFEPNVLVSGIVESIGPRVARDVVEIEVGQRVWFARQCGIPLVSSEDLDVRPECHGHPTLGLLWLHQTQLSVEFPGEIEALRNHYDDRQ